LTLTGEELVSHGAVPDGDIRETLLTIRIKQVDEILESRAHEYIDSVIEAAPEELQSIVNGTSLVTLVDRIEELVKLSKSYSNAARNEKLYLLANKCLAEMVDVVHQGYGSEIALVNKLVEPGTDTKHVSYVIRALEALGTMVSEFSYLRARLRGVSDLDPKLFLKIDLFIDQIPKHFSRNVCRYPKVLNEVIEKLAGSKTESEEAIPEQQRAMCLRALESLSGFKNKLTNEARARLRRLVHKP
jgi:hypothetical protein